MLCYLTPSDQCYCGACNTALPQGGTYWVRPNAHKPAVNCDSDDNQVNYPSVTANSAPPSDSYPAQSQCDYSTQRGYSSQPYVSSVNYAAPPYDFAAYLVSSQPFCVLWQIFAEPSSDHPRKGIPGWAVPNPALPTNWHPTPNFINPSSLKLLRAWKRPYGDLA
jgi:hypothetical protein